MNYRLKRLDLMWIAHPVVVVLALVGPVILGMGYKLGNMPLVFVGGAIYCIAILVLARPVLTLLLGILGFFGGILTFFVVPNPEMAGTPFFTRAIAAVLFTVLYAVIMDTLLVVASFLYNLLVQGVGLAGIGLELSAEDDQRSGEAVGPEEE